MADLILGLALGAVIGLVIGLKLAERRIRELDRECLRWLEALTRMGLSDE